MLICNDFCPSRKTKKKPQRYQPHQNRNRGGRALTRETEVRSKTSSKEAVHRTTFGISTSIKANTPNVPLTGVPPKR
jgi:hypothetical protein